MPREAEDTSTPLRLEDSIIDGNTVSQLVDSEPLREGEDPVEQMQSTPDEVLNSLAGQFNYKQESDSEAGLREPQIGALHAVSANWTNSSTEPITIVMPTGTGKTETMVAIFAAHRIPKLLVIVPSDALRIQISGKFETYGVLQKFGVIGSDAKKPLVGKLEHKLSSKLSAKGFAAACNVVITTAAALNENDTAVKKHFLDQFTHLFVDEAHHVAAATWREIRDSFTGKRVVQFTATPFREDGQRLGGKIAYSYSLLDAQKLGVFSNINYISVVDFDNIDRAIAKEAVDALNKDLEQGLDHILMARVRTQKKADSLLPLYTELAAELNPIVLHSGVKSKDKQQRLKQLLEHSSRIVICVDMLGEGFDLPSLKIAAIHEPHRSLGVTLQFVGRFARVGNENLGDATAVVGRGERTVDIRLRELYAENADWNKVIRNLSADAVGEQQEMSEFEQAFNNLPDDVSIINLAPKMSTVVYKTSNSRWHPEKVENLYKQRLLNPVAVNNSDHVLWFVTKDIESVRWGDIKSIAQTNYNLFLTYWDQNKGLLYINASDNKGVMKDLAEALCEDTVELYRGSDVYKTMASLKRRVATNVGLLDTRNQDSKFELRVGGDVIEALSEEARRNKTQTNIFARGVDSESGERLSVGASLRGRIWSYKAAVSIRHWMDWADNVGEKISDPNIDPAEVMDGFILSAAIQTRPQGYTVLGLEWPTEAWLDVSENVEIVIGESSAPFTDAELTVTEHNDTGDIPFTITLPDGAESSYKLRMTNGKMLFTATGNGARATYKRPRVSFLFEELLNEIGLRVLLEKEAIIEPEMVMVAPKTSAPAYRKELLKTLDWSNTDLNVESQGSERNPRSIQANVIEHLKNTDSWDLIIDDDGAGEVADVVAVKVEGHELKVNLVHCKYSSSAPGARVKDLYEVCGQAQKSIIRRRNPQLMLDKLIGREKRRRQKHGHTGIIIGDERKLVSVAEQAKILKPKFTITIVQPGVSKSSASDAQLELIAATQKYVQDSGGNTPLEVIVSP